MRVLHWVWRNTVKWVTFIVLCWPLFLLVIFNWVHICCYLNSCPNFSLIYCDWLLEMIWSALIWLRQYLWKSRVRLLELVNVRTNVGERTKVNVHASGEVANAPSAGGWHPKPYRLRCEELRPFCKNGITDSGKAMTECWNVDIVKLNEVTFSVYGKLKQLLFCISTVTTTSNAIYRKWC